MREHILARRPGQTKQPASSSARERSTCLEGEDQRASCMNRKLDASTCNTHNGVWSALVGIANACASPFCVITMRRQYLDSRLCGLSSGLIGGTPRISSVSSLSDKTAHRADSTIRTRHERLGILPLTSLCMPCICQCHDLTEALHERVCPWDIQRSAGVNDGSLQFHVRDHA